MSKHAFTIREDKMNVQEFYVQIIFKALMSMGYTCKVYGSISEASEESKDSLYVSISHYYSLRMWIKGYRKQLYWIQGSSPDESFMRNHSYIRKIIISFIELFALTNAKFVFMVSNSMLKHYQKKYHKNYSYKTYIMPCYNSEISKELFYIKNKYRNNVFCYVGSLSVWQCFPETVSLFKQLEDKIPNAILKVFTNDKEKAKSILDLYEVKNYLIKYVKPNELDMELSDCKFGFILRGKSPVNNVATPTKLSNYMAAGLIPIVSDSVYFFEEILGKSNNAVILNGNDDVKKIVDLSLKELNNDSVYSDYKQLFDNYYCSEKHIENIKNKLLEIEL